MRSLYLKNIYLSGIIILAFHFTSFSQVGINTTTPNSGSLLDIDSENKGVLIPRVNIDDLTSLAPVTDVPATAADLLSVESLLVYNTNTTTGKGFYYWNGLDRWVGIDGLNSNDWSLDGNTGTLPDDATTPNFIGTVDEVDFVTRTNNVERIRVNSTGNVGINGAPRNNYTAAVYGTDGQRGIYTRVDSGVGTFTISEDTGASNYGVIGVTGGLTARIPGDGSSIAIVGNSKNYGAYITVDDAGGEANRIAGVFALDSDDNVSTANDIANAQIAGTFNASDTTYGGFFSSDDFGVIAIGGVEEAILGLGDLRITENVQFEDYGTGAKLGTPTFALGVDAAGNVVEIDAELNQMAKFTNTDILTDLNVALTGVEVPIYSAAATFNDNPALYNRINTTNLEVNSDGRYQVVVNLSLTSADVRTNLRVQLKLDNATLGAVASNAYIRNNSNHNNSSINFTEIIDITAGQQLSINAIQEANAGTVNMNAGESTITIIKIK